jgi:MFS family permease
MVGVLNAAIGLGGLIGSVLSIALVGRSRLAVPFLGAIALWGGMLAASAIVPVLLPVIAFLVIGGAGKSLLDIAGTSLVQRTVPAASRRRTLTVLESVITGALAAGAVTASLLVDLFSAGSALLAGGALMVLVAVVAWPHVRAADDAVVVPETELVLLRTVPFFRPLQLDVIERLAAALERLQVPPGVEVTRQGDPGDRFTSWSRAGSRRALMGR